MKKKNSIFNYFIVFLIILIILVAVWMLVNGKKDDSGKPYTVYNDFVIYEDKDEKSLRYRVEVYADNIKYIHNFKRYPSDLLELDYEIGLKEKILYQDFENSIKKEKIYFSYNPQMDGADILTAGTLVQILGNSNAGIYKIPVVVSVSEDNGNPDFPVKTCEDSTNKEMVIELRYGEPKIYSDGECVIIQGNTREDFINMNDLLSYVLLGVIEE